VTTPRTKCIPLCPARTERVLPPGSRRAPLSVTG
jgi:hypothetical protein